MNAACKIPHSKSSYGSDGHKQPYTVIQHVSKWLARHDTAMRLRATHTLRCVLSYFPSNWVPSLYPIGWKIVILETSYATLTAVVPRDSKRLDGPLTSTHRTIDFLAQ